MGEANFLEMKIKISWGKLEWLADHRRMLQTPHHGVDGELSCGVHGGYAGPCALMSKENE